MQTSIQGTHPSCTTSSPSPPNHKSEPSSSKNVALASQCFRPTTLTATFTLLILRLTACTTPLLFYFIGISSPISPLLISIPQADTPPSLSRFPIFHPLYVSLPFISHTPHNQNLINWTHHNFACPNSSSPPSQNSPTPILSTF